MVIFLLDFTVCSATFIYYPPRGRWIALNSMCCIQIRPFFTPLCKKQQQPIRVVCTLTWQGAQCDTKRKTKLYLDYHVIFSDHWTWNGPQRSGRIFYSLSAPRFFPASCTPTFYSSLMIYPPPRQHIIFPLNKRVEMPQRHREENKNKLNFSCFTYTCYLRRI